MVGWLRMHVRHGLAVGVGVGGAGSAGLDSWTWCSGKERMWVTHTLSVDRDSSSSQCINHPKCGRVGEDGCAAWTFAL